VPKRETEEGQLQVDVCLRRTIPVRSTIVRWFNKEVDIKTTGQSGLVGNTELPMFRNPFVKGPSLEAGMDQRYGPWKVNDGTRTKWSNGLGATDRPAHKYSPSPALKYAVTSASQLASTSRIEDMVGQLWFF